VQRICEDAAHRLLRDGDCADEVAEIQRSLKEISELADKETKRVRENGGPEALNAAEEPVGGGAIGCRAWASEVQRSS
jgi:hypothetical protein